MLEKGLFWSNMNYFTIFDQRKPFSYAYISTTANPIDMIQSAVYLYYLVLNSSYFCRLSHEVFVKLSKPHFFHFFLHGAGYEIQISYLCQRCTQSMCILSYIYGSHSLELGEAIELFYLVQDFCLVTVSLPHLFLPDSGSPVGFLLDFNKISQKAFSHIFSFPFLLDSHGTPSGLQLNLYKVNAMDS